jgi:putative ABC transport system permease protein
MGVLSTSPWRRAPRLIWRQPAVVAAVAGGVLVLVAAAAATPLFQSSSRSAVQQLQVERRCRADLGITVPQVTDRDADDRAIRAAAAGVPGLDAPVASSETITFATRGGTGEDAPRVGVTVMARDGALDHVERVAGSSAQGDLWVDTTLAEQLEVGPGDPLVLGRSSVPVIVAGVYRSLRPRMEADPLDRYWCAERLDIVADGYASDPPPLLVLVEDPATYDRVVEFGRLGPAEPDTTWMIAPTDDVSRLDRAEAQLDRMNDIDRRVREDVDDRAEGYGPDRTEGFRTGSSGTELEFVVQRSQAVASSVGGSILPVTLAALVTASCLVAAAGSYWVDRRRDELTMLGGRGVGPSAIGVKAALELVGPAVLGGLGGLVTAVVLVGRLGPSSVLEPAAIGAAARNGLLAVAGAVAVLGVVAGLRSRRLGDERHHRLGRHLGRVPWEVVPMLAAYRAYDRAGVHGVPVAKGIEVAEIDVLALAFPLLFILGVVAVAARLLRVGLLVLRRRGGRLPTPAYLAARRLAGAPALVVILMAASATAVGTLAYSAQLTESLDASLVAKARLSVGSDVATSIIGRGGPPEAVAGDTTRVLRVDETQLSYPQVDILAVDPDTFERGVTWDRSFSSLPLPELLDRIRDPGRGRVPALVLNGGLPPEATIDFAARNVPDLPLDGFAAATAFPTVGNRALVVVDRAGIERVGLRGTVEHWTSGDPERIATAYEDEPVRYLHRSDRVIDATSFASVQWTFGYLRALGLTLALIGVGGLLLYLDTRQRERVVAYAFLRRMGLSRRGHRRAVLLEVGVTLMSGCLLGTALAAVAGRLILSRIDPVPSVAPAPVVRYPLDQFAATVAATLLVCWCGAWLAQQAADRARSAEVLRLEV